MKFTLHLVPMSPQRSRDTDMNTVIEFEAADLAAAILEGNKRALTIDAQTPLKEVCLCSGHQDLTADLVAARAAKLETIEKATLAKLKAKYPTAG